MLIKKSFKYRVYPTRGQQELLAQHFGAKRFVWNHFLEQRKDAYLKNKKTLNYFDNAGELTKLKKKEDTRWLRKVNSQSVQASLRDLDVAYNRFFHKTSKFPRFKSRKDKQSFRVPQSVTLEGSDLWIPKFKKALKTVVHRPLEGEILFATISKNQAGEYFVSITCDVEHTPMVSTGKTIGIDLGLKDLVVCSDGTRFPALKQNKKHQKRLAYEQRQMSKKVKDGKNRNRQRVEVAKLYQKMANVRSNHLHNISAKLVRENQTICFENLAVKNLMRNHCLAGAIADVAWGELIRQIKYKSEWNGRSAIEIDRFFPSSKTCYDCGYVNQDLRLSDRVWTCPRCGKVLDRDHNASRNIEREGLHLSGLAINSDLKQKGMKAFAKDTTAESTKCQAAGLKAQQ